ncbi:MAG: energy-coupling factor transporter ATPase [Lachnospiraceae bacterium]|nr:energy-coupling factor transporter ATPase [Lachnospiraceae bacterium]
MIAQARDVAYHYIRRDEEGRVVRDTAALSSVSFDIERGEFIAILGHNGSGKSTLAKHLNGLLTPGEGAVLIEGMDTRDGEQIWNIRRIAGMVFQNPDNQIIGQIVEEDVAFGPENLGVPPQEIAERVQEALARVGMTEKRRFSPNKLSGGQKQRVSIAGVLAMRPKILILDEPTAMLDPEGRREVLEAVHSLNRRERITVILITHDMEEAVDADRIYVMDGGRIALTGTPREVFAQAEQLAAIGLTVPMAVAVAGLLRQEGLAVEGTPLTQEELVEAICRAADKITGDIK